MKSLLILIVTLLSANCFATFVSQSEIDAGQIKSFYTKKCSDCLKMPKGVLIENISVIDKMVDDSSKPIYEAKSNVVACSAVVDDPATTEVDETKSLEEDCISKQSIQVCDVENGYEVVRLEDNSEVYCTKLLGYEQMPSGAKMIVEDVSKKLAFEAAQSAKNAKDAAISMAKGAIECGRQVIAMLVVQNASKGLNTGQIKQMNKTYRDIKELLETGSLASAREEILSATADGTLVTETDKTVLVAELDSCNP